MIEEGSKFWYGLKSEAYVQYSQRPLKMTRGCLILNLLCFCALSVYAQGEIIKPHGRNTGPAKVIDTTYVQLYYALCASDIHDESTYRDYFCLEVGRKNVKFYSYNWVGAIEGVRKWKKEHGVPANAGLRVIPHGNYKQGWSEYQYSEWYMSDGKLTEYSCFPLRLGRYNCYHEEKYPNQDWIIWGDTMTFCGYLCQKATCHFSGREFTAWFTQKIPVRNGPWKFGGLPGAILKVSDKDNLYDFECVKIEQKRKPLYKEGYSSYNKMDREDLLKIQRKIHEDIGSLWGNPKSEPEAREIPRYEPLELK